VQYVLERPPPPQGKRSSERLTRTGGFVREHRACGACEALEARRIELVEVDPERVARRTRGQHPVRVISRSARLKNSSQLRDVEPELPAGFCRVVGPERIDDPIRRHDVVWVHQEQREQRPLCRRADPRRDAVADDFDRPQHPEFQHSAHGFCRIEFTT
jgi:hypothetical protein